MKRLRFFLFAILSFLFAQHSMAQVINVPDKSKDHFAKQYPEAKNVDWSNNVTNYTAAFNLDSAKYEAHYRVDGTWNYTSKQMKLTDFPEAVQTSVKNSRFSSWKVTGTDYIENSDSQKLYRVLFKRGSLEKIYVFYDKDGKEIKNSKTL